MSAVYKRLTDTQSCGYRNKCNFDQPRSGRFNKNHLQGARCIKALTLGFLIVCSGYSMYSQYLIEFNPILVSITFYSYWGMLSALFSQLFSIIACNREGWFKTAYLATEFSYAVNTMVMFFFWVILMPNVLLYPKEGGLRPRGQLEMFFGITMHIVPWITNILDLYMTDMALEKSHWWIGFVAVFPFYMLCNIWGSFAFGDLQTGDKGTLYGFEDWINKVPLSLFLFLLMATLQGAFFYCSAVCVEKKWPKRPEEEFNRNDQETNLPGEIF